MNSQVKWSYIAVEPAKELWSIKNLDYATSGLNPFGIVHSGTLIVEGPVAQVKFPEGYIPHWKDERQFLRPVGFSIKIQQSQDKEPAWVIRESKATLKLDTNDLVNQFSQDIDLRDQEHLSPLQLPGFVVCGMACY